MLICPKCKIEYRDGYTICSDCNCDLVEKPEENTLIEKGSGISQFVILVVTLFTGLLIILCSPIISYKLTSLYFIPNGSGQYNGEHFMWMLKAYHYSFLLIGSIICLFCFYIGTRVIKNNK